MSWPVVDGIRCSAPHMALDNDGFSADCFAMLYEAEARNFWFRSRNRILCGLIARFMPPGDAKFLDLGCGTGFVLNELSRRYAYQFTGADSFLEGLKYARARAPRCEFVQLDATAIPYEQTFSAVGCFDVIEHIERDDLVLDGIHRCLKPEGLLFLTVPQHPFLWSECDVVACHKRRYTRSTLTDRLRRAGFRPIFLTSFVFGLFPFMAASRLRHRLPKGRPATLEETFAAQGLLLQPPVDAILDGFMHVDELLIRAGVSLPFGGSLIAVARKN